MVVSSDVPRLTRQAIFQTPETKRNALVEGHLLSLVARAASVSPDDLTTEEPLSFLGIDSLKLIALKQGVEDDLRIVVPMDVFLNDPSIADLTAEVVARLTPSATDDEPKPLLVITANFTIEPLRESLAYWLEFLATPTRIEFAPYNQIFQQLLDPNSLLRGNSNGVNLLFLRAEDWLRDSGDDWQAGGEARAERLECFVAEFVTALEAATLPSLDAGGPGEPRASMPFLVFLCPHSDPARTDPMLGPLLRRLDSRLLMDLRRLPGVQVFDTTELAALYKVDAPFDPYNEMLGHIPFTPEFFAALGTFAARMLVALLRPPFKVIALDCDNTLWQGVCGENGPDGVQISSAHEVLQRALLRQRDLGVLLCLCSKNSEEDVLAVFRHRSEMPLTLDSIVSYRINWHPKSQNLAELAHELSLSLDSFLFLDDNPLECAEVRARCPEVTVLQLPERAEDIPAFLDHLWAFDHLGATNEDWKRTELYKQNREREQLRVGVQTLDDFLQRLELRITIAPIATEEVPRAAQLTHRTNQFNLTTIRRTEGEIGQLLASATVGCFGVKVSDRFGNYGLVGLMIYRVEPERLAIDSFMLSCRVLGRRIEHAMLEHLAEVAARLHKRAVLLSYRETAKNTPARLFLDRLGAEHRTDREDGFDLELPPMTLRAVLDKDRRGHNSPVQAVPREPVPGENPHVATHPPGSMIGIPCDRYQRIAAEFRTAERVLRAVRSRIVARPALTTPYAAPRTSLEQEMAAIWAEILLVDRVGRHDDFFQLGGDSLASAQLLARIHEVFRVDLSLSVLQNPTLAGVAQAVEETRRGGKPDVVAALTSLHDEVRLDPGISAAGLSALPPRSPRSIFLTGASGYLGAHLLAELLRRTEARVFCLVRAKDADEGWHRIRRNLKFFSLWDEALGQRIVALVGDFSQPRLGLPAERWEALAAEVDVIYHNGAWVNFIYPYSVLKAANARGTEEILRLATHASLKPVHYISTIGVLMSEGYPHDAVLMEDGELDHSEGLPNGYEQTKWVGDRIMDAARVRGVPSSIYRPCLLTGDSRTGVYPKLNEFAPCFFKGCIQLGSIPRLNTVPDLVPIDFASKAIIEISLDQDSLGKNFHIGHPRPVHMDAIIDWLHGFGYPLRAIPWDVWKQELAGLGSSRSRNALYPYSDFIAAMRESQARIPSFDHRNMMAVVTRAGISCPDELEMLERYFEYFIRTGYVEPPRRRRMAAFNGTTTMVPPQTTDVGR